MVLAFLRMIINPKGEKRKPVNQIDSQVWVKPLLIITLYFIKVRFEHVSR